MSQHIVRRQFIARALLAGAGALVAGCGQKGPLFLPEDILEKKKKEKTSAAPVRQATV